VRRVLLAVALAVTALLAPAAAQAQRAWQPPQPLTGDPASEWWNADDDMALTVTAQGETIAAFTEGDWPSASTLKLRTPTGTQTLAGTRAELASDSLGNAYLAYSPPEPGSVQLRVRPAGGEFGAAEPIGPAEVLNGATLPRLFATPSGDLAAVWNLRGNLYAAFRPYGGSFGEPQSLGLYAGYNSWSAAYSENGELVVAESENFDHAPGSVTTLIRTPAGEQIVKNVNDGARYAGVPAVGIDDSGRALVTWAERPKDSSWITRVLVTQRPSGGTFGGRTALTKPGGDDIGPQLAVAGDGSYTITYSSKYGRRVAVGRAGEPPRHLRTYISGRTPRLAKSPSGNQVLLGRHVSGGQLVSSLRTGDANFAPGQDVRTDCGRADFAELAVSDAGHAAAVIQSGTQVLLVTDAPGGGSQGCFPPDGYNPSYYDSDPFVPRVSAPSEAGWQPGGAPGANPCCLPPAPPVVPELVAGNPSLKRAAPGTRTRQARLIVICGRACTIRARAEIGFGAAKKPIAISEVETVESKGRAQRVDIPIELDATDVKEVDKQLTKNLAPQPLRLSVTITATSPGEKKRTRTTSTLINRPGSPF
jgi:hypothetical protein